MNAAVSVVRLSGFFFSVEIFMFLVLLKLRVGYYLVRILRTLGLMISELPGFISLESTTVVLQISLLWGVGLKGYFYKKLMRAAGIFFICGASFYYSFCRICCLMFALCKSSSRFAGGLLLTFSIACLIFCRKAAWEGPSLTWYCSDIF